MKKIYSAPKAEMVKFDYNNQVVAQQDVFMLSIMKLLNLTLIV